jgi:GT2 family glycosyltransferase
MTGSEESSNQLLAQPECLESELPLFEPTRCIDVRSSTNRLEGKFDYVAESPLARMRVAVGIATRGRPEILAETIGDLEKQSRRPDSIWVAYSDPSDIADLPVRFPHVHLIQTRLGLTVQRNAILDALSNEDVLTFLDDDFFLHRDYLAVIEDVLISHPHIVATTGKLLADGINGAGFTVSRAKSIIARARGLRRVNKLTSVFNAYGCNMSMRMEPIRTHRLRFDENLPLYGWYEDVEFSRQLARHGDIVRVRNACGVHLGAKVGRQSGVKLGYSQVANPFYLARKRSVGWEYAVASMVSRSMKNLVRSAAPEPFVDRLGRLQGNLKGWRELVEGTISPTRILEL